MKRMYWLAIGLGALLLVGAFLAGTISTHPAGAQAPARPAAQQAAGQHAAAASAAASSAQQPILLAQTQAQPPAQTQPQGQTAPPAGAGAAPAGTPEPTEVAGTPEPTEVAGTPEPTEVADQGETGGPNNEAADAAALAAQASITKQQAESAALAANPGTTVTKTDLGDENGTIVYDVELSNGSDVKVNAKTGAIVSTDQAGTDGAETGEADQAGDQGP